MTKDVAKHIFTPFYRASGQDPGSGVGLGLSIVREIVAAHGGCIRFETNENSGTIFTFTLQVKDGGKLC